MTNAVKRLVSLPPEQLRLMATSGFVLGILLLGVLLALAVFILYTAASGMQPWGQAHLVRAALGCGIIILILRTPLETWLKLAYWLYGCNILLLLLIPLLGSSNMGAQRWFILGGISLQPSEPMKIFVILALARYFHLLNPKEVFSIPYLLPPVAIIALPMILIMRQPDLGTALMILFVGITALFIVGVRWQKFASLLGLTLITGPLVWNFLLHDFQRQRITSFLNPEKDLLGAGYQLMQSKIAIGSGQWSGTGLMQGTQNLLGFIPAKHTDFIFTVYAEQFGFQGSLAILTLILVLMLYCVLSAAVMQSTFARIITLCIGSLWVIQAFINLAMVMGLLPVVGIPLPFLSYGGTSLLTCMAGFGLILNGYIHQYATLR